MPFLPVLIPPLPPRVRNPFSLLDLLSHSLHPSQKTLSGDLLSRFSNPDSHPTTHIYQVILGCSGAWLQAFKVSAEETAFRTIS